MGMTNSSQQWQAGSGAPGTGSGGPVHLVAGSGRPGWDTWKKGGNWLFKGFFLVYYL